MEDLSEKRAEEYFQQRFMENYALEPIVVRHQDLTRFSDSAFKSICPQCGEGGLWMVRSSEDFYLQANDICQYCGRRFIYTDILPTVTLEYTS